MLLKLFLNSQKKYTAGIVLTPNSTCSPSFNSWHFVLSK